MPRTARCSAARTTRRRAPRGRDQQAAAFARAARAPVAQVARERRCRRMPACRLGPPSSNAVRGCGNCGAAPRNRSRACASHASSTGCRLPSSGQHVVAAQPVVLGRDHQVPVARDRCADRGSAPRARRVRAAGASPARPGGRSRSPAAGGAASARLNSRSNASRRPGQLARRQPAPGRMRGQGPCVRAVIAQRGGQAPRPGARCRHGRR